MKDLRLYTKYLEAQKKVAKELGINNVMAAPHITKVVVNAGLGELSRSKEFKEQAIRDFATITGQKPSVRLAKISVASFAVREGMPVGLKVTLRKDKLFNFLDRLISIVLPRLRDFKGTPLKSFDSAGNYTLGLSEHIVFPEIDLAKSPKPFGLEITVVVNNSNKEKSKLLLTEMGFPFQKEEN